MVLFTIIGDLFRDHELSGWGKAVWIFFLVFLPFLTGLIYDRARQRDARALPRRPEGGAAADGRLHPRDGGGSSDVDEIAMLADLHEKGKLDRPGARGREGEALG